MNGVVVLLYRHLLILLLLITTNAVSSSDTSQRNQVIDFLSNIESHGFSVDDKDWVSIVKDTSGVNLRRIYNKYLQFLDSGRLNKALFQSGWEIPDRKIQLSDTGQFLPVERAQSQIPEYEILRKALHQLKWWQENALQVFPDDVILFEEDKSLHVEKLNDWLLDIDLLSERLGDTYSQQHLDVFTQVQLDHSLLPDGRFGPSTRQVLLSITNVRIKTLKANLERLRWLPQELKAPYVWLDIPGFKVSWIGSKGEKYHHKAIVGKSNSQTPVLQDSINSVSINPVWKVPHRIASRLLINEQKKPGILRKEGFVVYESWDDRAKIVDMAGIKWKDYSPQTFRFRLEQQPGERNRLGKYKFNMRNEYSIYLHDTNDRILFGREKRMFSSGCVRIDDVEIFVSYMISMKNIMSDHLLTDVTSKVLLKKPVDVYLSYFTAWPDGDGRVRFREDVYNLDSPLVSWF